MIIHLAILFNINKLFEDDDLVNILCEGLELVKFCQVLEPCRFTNSIYGRIYELIMDTLKIILDVENIYK